MSPGEIAGLSATVGLLGGCLAAIVTAVVVMRRQHLARDRARVLEAYAAWLAARLTLSRASGSFVTAVRAFAASRDHPNDRSRRQEAMEQARARRYDALRSFDVAEAALLTWCPDRTVADDLVHIHGIDANSLKSAINGDEAAVDRFLARLRHQDRQAMDLVRQASADLPHLHKAPILRGASDNVMARLQRLADHWTKP